MDHPRWKLIFSSVTMWTNAGQKIKAEGEMCGGTLFFKESLPRKMPHATPTLASPAFVHSR